MSLADPFYPPAGPYFRFAQFAQTTNGSAFIIFAWQYAVIKSRPAFFSHSDITFYPELRESAICINLLTGSITTKSFESSPHNTAKKDHTMPSFWNHLTFHEAAKGLTGEIGDTRSIFDLSPIETVNYHQWSGKSPEVSKTRNKDGSWGIDGSSWCEPPRWEIAAFDQMIGDRFILFRSHMDRDEVFNVATALESILSATRNTLSPWCDVLKISRNNNVRSIHRCPDGIKSDLMHMLDHISSELGNENSALYSSIRRANKNPVPGFFNEVRDSAKSMEEFLREEAASAAAKRRRFTWFSVARYSFLAVWLVTLISLITLIVVVISEILEGPLLVLYDNVVFGYSVARRQSFTGNILFGLLLAALATYFLYRRK